MRWLFAHPVCFYNLVVFDEFPSSEFMPIHCMCVRGCTQDFTVEGFAWANPGIFKRRAESGGLPRSPEAEGKY